MIIIILMHAVQAIFWGIDAIKTGRWEIAIFLAVAEGFILLSLAVVDGLHDTKKLYKEGSKDR